MKKVKLTSLGALVALAVLTSCDESMDFGNMTGTILPNVTYDATVAGTPGAGSRVSEFDQIKVEDLTLTLTSADGNTTETFSAGNFPTDRSFAVGKYTLAASYGDMEDEGFEKPAVYGSTELTVLEGKATQVNLTAVPSKSMVGIQFDEAALNYFTELKASLHSVGGQTIEYASDETRFAYLKPGEVTVDVTFTKPNGKGGTLEVARFTAAAQHRYTLGITLGGEGAGDAALTITFDETLALDDVTVDISDEVLTVPAPEVTLSGATPGQTLNVVAGSSPTPLRVDIKAPGGIKSAVLTTTGTLLNLPEGWPAEIDLATASTDQQKILTDLGFKNIGIFNNPGKLAAFELTDVIANLPATIENAAPVTFALKVTDKNGKVASEEPLTFAVKVDKLALALEPLSGYTYAGEETVNMAVAYNGTDDLSKILKVTYLATTGTMKPAEVVNVQPQSRASQTYTVSIKTPADAQLPIRLKAAIGNLTTDEIEIPQAPAPVVAVANNDVFATSAWAVVSSDSYGVASKTIEIQIATGNGNFTKATGVQNGAEFHITEGLTPNTEYRLRAKVGVLISEPVTFTTEAATQIPGGNMDSWTTQEVSASTNKWTKHIPSSQWATLNDFTLSKVNWKCVRSGAESTQSTDDSHSGKAAVVRTVGWDTATTFNDCAQHTAGELYLGSYSNGAANYGIPFTSRPSALNFWCKFSKFKDGETGVAEIEVLDTDGQVIASGRLTPNNADYQQLSINLNYARGAKKAATLRVKFKSNAKEGLNKDDVQSFIGGNATTRPVGSQFFIDDIELVY